jgi:hypothetical protein
LTGTQLNGVSEGANYGDDNQSASNYPIVQLTDLNGNVSYATTSYWSSTRVATGNTPEHVTFALPGGDVPGVYYLSTIANGIASTPVLFVLGSSGDTVTVGSTNFLFFTFPSVTINGTPVFYNPAAIAGIDIVVGANSAINVQQTYVPVDIEGGGDDTVNIGSQAPNLGGTLANINAPVHVGNSFGSLTFDGSTFGSTTLNVDDSGDTSVNAAHMGTIFGDPGLGYIDGLAPALITYDYKTTASLDIRTSAADGDVFGVWENGVPTTIHGNGLATVTVGDGFVGVQSILSTLNIENSPSFTTISIDDSADTGARDATLGTFTPPGDSPWGYITGLSASANINYEYADTASVTISTGTGGATVNVLATGVATSLQGNANNTTVNVGDANGVQDIQGILTVNSTDADAVDLNLNDQADAAGRTVTLTSGSVSGMSPADIDYGLNALANLNVNGGTGSNIFSVRSTPAPIFIRFVGIAFTNTTINCSGADTVNVGDANGVQDVQGSLTINSTLTDFVNLNLNDQADTVGRMVTLTSGSVSGLAPADIDYSVNALANLNVNGGTGANTFKVQSTPAPIFVRFVGIAFTSTVALS